MEQLTFVTELVLDLVPQLDVPGQILVGDQNSTNWAGLFGHQGVFPQASAQPSKVLTFKTEIN